MPCWRGELQYICLIGYRRPPIDGYVAVCLVLTIDVYDKMYFVKCTGYLTYLGFLQNAKTVQQKLGRVIKKEETGNDLIEIKCDFTLTPHP